MLTKPLYATCTGKNKYNSCSKLGVLIVNKSTQQCFYCNEKRKRDAKANKNIWPKSKIRKPTGEYALFMAIAKTRQHICYVTKTPVNIYKSDKTLNVNCFMHVLSKGAYPKFRLLDINIVIAHPKIHDIYDNGDRTKLVEYEGGKDLLELHDELIAKYYLNNGNF